MSRPLRIEFPGAVSHVTSRGNARQWIFEGDDDRKAFLDLLGETVGRFHWLCHAYCLMGNNYRLLLETPEANLSRGMRELNGRYTQAFNRRHGRVGHLLQGRYKAILVDRQSYLLELCRHVVLNPVRAGTAASPVDYPWSSYLATAGKAGAPQWLQTDWALGQFGDDRPVAERRYAAFVKAGVQAESPWEHLSGQVLLGDEAFREKMTTKLHKTRSLKEVPRSQRYANRPTLAKLIGQEVLPLSERNNRIRQAHVEHGYTLSEIGRALGLHYSTISKALKPRARS